MKKKIPEKKERVEELKEKLKEENRPRSQQRLHMLYVLKSEQAKSRQEVAELLAVHRHTIGNWLSCYEEEGIEGMLELKTRPNRAYSLSASAKEKLEEQLKNPVGFGSYKEVGRFLREQIGVELKYPTVYKIVRKDLGAKWKVPRKSHIYKDEAEVKEFKESLEERLKKK